jgi:hypothetical protein
MSHTSFRPPTHAGDITVVRTRNQQLQKRSGRGSLTERNMINLKEESRLLHRHAVLIARSVLQEKTPSNPSAS